MYTKRIQLANYGPIQKLDIEFPIEGDLPKPVVLVGENGSGKSILLSHIVNGLILAKDAIYPETSELERDNVYKLRSSSYIKSGTEFYFGRVDFEEGLFVEEIRSRRLRREYKDVPGEPSDPDILGAWAKMSPDEHDYFGSNLSDRHKIEEIFSKRCVLYFPASRFEEPAWLNEENLKAQAQYMDLKRTQGQTSRKVINHSSLHENQNWLFGVIFDRAAFEIQTSDIRLPIQDGSATLPLPIFRGYSGDATSTYETALRIVRTVINRGNTRFGVGRRLNRVVSIESGVGQVVPNIFQLSSGETSLLNLFLSILRDYNLSGASFSGAEDLRGIVVVDEIDLHLHSVHQYEILPSLIQMFPKVQFIATTHSPLFVLGMSKILGENGFALYRLPQGSQISPEEFSEFGDAYQAFAATRTFSDDMRTLIGKSQKPIVFVEGPTDVRYIERASEILKREEVLKDLSLRYGDGSGNLAKMWKDSLLPLTQALPQEVLLLFDCDTNRRPAKKGRLLQRSIPSQDRNPIRRGIENLFGKPTLERARQYKAAFFRTEAEHAATDGNGQPTTIPEKWTVNEKTELCDWLCEHGTSEDFRQFQLVFDLIEEAIDSTPRNLGSGESATTQ